MALRQVYCILFLLISIQLQGQIDSVLSRIHFEMDYRFRAEQDWDSRKSDGSFRENRSRLRYRLRTGVTYTYKWYSFGFRLRTGDPRKQQDPQLTLGTGPKEFGTLLVGFEKAFFQFQKKKVKFWIGKNTYPFKKNNELFWSDNVFPEGVMIHHGMDPLFDWMETLSVTGGHFVLASNNGSFSDDAYFQGLQVLFTSKEKRVEVFPALYLFRNIPDIPDGAHSFLMDYSILHFGSKVKPIKSRPLYVDFDFYQNVTNYRENNDIPSGFANQKTGYTIGVQYGQIKQKDHWMFKLTYANLERYSILDYMAQNDWARWDYSAFDSPDGRLSNYRGIEAVIACAITDKINLVTKYYIVSQLIPYGDEKETGQRIRFDINIKL